MRIIQLFTLLFFVCLFQVVIAQIKTDSIKNIEIIQDDRTDQLLQKHKIINEKFQPWGYRVQIFFDSGNKSRKRAKEIKAKFLSQYPDDEAYILFREPYFRVRVGDFRTRIEAEGFMKKIIKEYSGAFVIRDEISFPKLKYFTDLEKE